MTTLPVPHIPGAVTDDQASKAAEVLGIDPIPARRRGEGRGER